MSTLNRYDKICCLLIDLPIDNESREAFQRKARIHWEECGCTAGGISGVLAIIGIPFYWGYSGPSIITLLKILVFLMLIMAIGKLAGIGTARLKLLLLYYKLSKLVKKSLK